LMASQLDSVSRSNSPPADPLPARAPLHRPNTASY
jgi:hypothetical protein